MTYTNLTTSESLQANAMTTAIPPRGSSEYAVLRNEAEESLKRGEMALSLINNFVPIDSLVRGTVSKKELRDYYSKDRWSSTAILSVLPQLISVIQTFRGVPIKQVAPSLILAFYNRYFSLEDDKLVETFIAFKGLYQINDDDNDDQLSTTGEVVSLISLVLQVIAVKNPSVREAAESTNKFNRIIGQISNLLPIIISVIGAIFKKK